MAVPMVVLPPPRFSMMTGCFSCSESFGPSTRVSVSFAPPGGTGTTMRIGFVGYSCAVAVAQTQRDAARIANAWRREAGVMRDFLGPFLLPPMDADERR